MKNKILEQLLKVSSIPHLYKNVQITHLPTKKDAALSFDVTLIFNEPRFDVPPKFLTYQHIALVEVDKIILVIQKKYPRIFIGGAEFNFDYERINKNTWIISFEIYPPTSLDVYEKVMIESNKIIFDLLSLRIYKDVVSNQRRLIN